MSKRSIVGFIALALAAAVAGARSLAVACPFCGAVQSTLSQDISRSDVAIIAQLVELPPQTENKDGELNIAPPQAKFKVLEVLRGQEALGNVKEIEAPFFDDKPVGGEYLIMGAQPPAVMWSPPSALTPRSRKYVSEITKLPVAIPARLVFFQDYLDDKEDILNRDSFDEFALAPYSDLQILKPHMQHDKLVERVQDPQIMPSHRRLYLTMLGICGGPADLPVLEKLMRSDDQKFKMGLDATVACYLTLKGADGLPLVEDLFLKTKQKEEFTDIFSVVMALRFIGQQEQSVIPRDKIVPAMRMVLDHPRLADQAVMDLARWQDWTVMDRLVALFKSPDPETASWVRIPVINYLRACPWPKAKEYIAELRKIDPQAVEQSETLYPIGPQVTAAATSRAGAAGSSVGTASSNTFAGGSPSSPVASSAAATPMDSGATAPIAAGPATANKPVADATPVKEVKSETQPAAANTTAADKAEPRSTLPLVLIGLIAVIGGIMVVTALVRSTHSKQEAGPAK
jgi:hypothetical protein